MTGTPKRIELRRVFGGWIVEAWRESGDYDVSDEHVVIGSEVGETVQARVDACEGEEEKAEGNVCLRCAGSGTLVKTGDEGHPCWIAYQPCPSCHGSGLAP